MRYLVTGGCGFIGSHLCDRLVRMGHGVRVLDDLSTGRRENLPAEAELVVGDVADRETVFDAMSGMDGCFHLAAIASVQRSVEDWLGTNRTNLVGTIAVFDAARRHGALPVVYASSAAVYGDNPTMPLIESAVPNPLSAYGADKLACELHARVASLVHRIPVTGFRFFNVFGPRQDPNSPYSGVISIFAARLLAGQALTVFGDGLQSRDFVFVGDVVDHLLAAIDRPADQSRIFNICTGNSTNLLQLIDVLGELISITPKVTFQPARPSDIRVSLGSPALCRQELGVTATSGLKEGLSVTLASLR